MIRILFLYRPTKPVAWLLAFAVIYILLALAGLRGYLQFQSMTGWLALGLIFAVGRLRPVQRPSIGIFCLAAACILLYLLIPAKTILFSAIAFGALYLLETFAGRVNHLVLFAAVIATPIFEYFSNVFSFPVRLYLTTVAGKILQQIDPGWKAEGNLLVSDSGEYSVDPACLGLHMLTVSLLAAIALAGILGKKKQKQIKPAHLFIVLLIVVFMNCLSNLTRIITLVFFNIAPGNILHDLAGLACFVFYILVPARFLVGWWLDRFGLVIQAQPPFRLQVPGRAELFLHGILLAGIFSAMIVNRHASVNDRSAGMPVTMNGYTTSRLNDHIIRLKNEQALIYIKPIAGFFASDHQPTIYWAGSGYAFRRIREMHVEDGKVYAAVLEKGKERLYTAWWYTDGSGMTISQWDWRKQALMKGSRFRLINITVADPADLISEIRAFRKQYRQNL